MKRQLRLKKKRRGWKKLTSRVKQFYKKKIYFKWFLIKRYHLRKIAPLKSLVVAARRLRGNKVTNLFYFLELHLPIICLRLYFFWRLSKAHHWISKGFVFVNGSVITKVAHRIKLQDMITLSLHPKYWQIKLYKDRRLRKKRLRKYRSFNCTEISFRCLSAVIYMLPYKFSNIKYYLRKRRKIWIRSRAFAFLMNSFH